MERWKKPPPPPPPPPRPRRGYSCDHPSFSSTLLDAIYRSIDEPEGGAAAAAAKHPPPADTWRGATVRERDAAPRRTQPQTQPPPPPPQKKQQQQQRRRGAYSTSSSSECSSYGGFSSSEPESAPRSARHKPILTGSRPDPLHHHHPAAIQSPGLAQPLPAEKKKPSSIRSRIREFRRSSKAPASPGARLASFLNSIFAAAAGNPRKPSKRPAATDIAASCGESASACSTASSYSRSCLTKTPSTRGGLPPAPAPPPPPPLTAAAKRSVRFGPVSVIVDEERRRPCEKKLPYGGDPPPTARKRAEAMALGFGGEEEEEEEEEDEGESDASSDLFELESLAVAGDELPVYETTSFLTNRAIAHGLIV